MERSTVTGRPLSSVPHHHMAVEYVEGVGVNTCTCSGWVPSSLEQKDASSRMWSRVHPGWAAIR